MVNSPPPKWDPIVFDPQPKTSKYQNGAIAYAPWVVLGSQNGLTHPIWPIPAGRGEVPRPQPQGPAQPPAHGHRHGAPAAAQERRHGARQGLQAGLAGSTRVRGSAGARAEFSARKRRKNMMRIWSRGVQGRLATKSSLGKRRWLKQV